MRQGADETGRQVHRHTRRQGDKGTTRQGDKETGRQRDKELPTVGAAGGTANLMEADRSAASLNSEASRSYVHAYIQAECSRPLRSDLPKHQ